MAKRLALMLLSVLVALLAAEALVRVAGVAPKVYAIRKGRFQLSHNPRIGYEPAPLVYNGQELSFYDYLGASNSLGYRDREHSLAKPAGTYRIVVIGDSVAAGLHVERNEDIFAPLLEQQLNRAGLHAEVINLAVSGYNTQQEVETLRDKGLAYHPDLVLLAYTMSSREHLDGDILKTLLAAEAERRDGGISDARVSSWLVKSALYRFLRYRVTGAARRRPAPAETPQHYLDLVSADTVAPYFGILKNLAAEHHFQVLVAVFPRFVRNFRAYPLGAQHQYVHDLAQQNGFALADLLVPFSDCRDAASAPGGAGEPISTDYFHPTPYGHRCAAAALAKAVLALPPRPPGP
jgi:lysophospholipase L1-like esterase